MNKEFAHHRLASSLAGQRIGHTVIFHAETASTNDVARSLAETGHPLEFEACPESFSNDSASNPDSANPLGIIDQLLRQLEHLAVDEGVADAVDEIRREVGLDRMPDLQRGLQRRSRADLDRDDPHRRLQRFDHAGDPAAEPAAR